MLFSYKLREGIRESIVHTDKAPVRLACVSATDDSIYDLSPTGA